MNMNYHEAQKLLDQIIVERTQIPADVHLIIAPPALYLSEFSSAIQELPNISLAAQNCHTEEKGAYTGEISAAMLASLNIKYCLVGHSERRAYFGESNASVSEKVNRLLHHGVQPIVCVGEELEQRQNNSHFDVVKEQVHAVLDHLQSHDSDLLIWAYEPVWAIGTGKTATAEQAQEVHQAIRQQLGANGEGTRVLYGGSVKAANAAELFAQPDIDGALVGGASLNSAEFGEICKLA